MMIKRIYFSLITVVLLCGYLTAGDIITITGKKIIHDSGELDKKEGFFSGRAKTQFLNLERDKSYGLPKKALSADVVDTISIIAFRIGFTYEETDDATTTGRGSIDTRDSLTFVTDEGHWLDPSPHNKHYFESHLRSLNQYWSMVSYGKIHLEYEVWPRGDDLDTSSYQLDHPIAYYGEQPPNFGLGEFFHDALTRAYEIDGDSFSFVDERGNKKAVILFHAGADRQTDLDFSDTPTPNDLFTGFLTFDGVNILVLGNDSIPEGVIMPETMTQDNRVTVMNAVMAHEFGHQLGLVDLYNTGSNPFLSQFGDFALMDNNGLNTAAEIDEYGTGAFGTVPIFPSAWSRAYLGFEEVVEYREGTTIELAAVKMRTDDVKIAKVPISETEYYLIENRRGALDGTLDALRVDSTSNVVLWPVDVQEIIDGDSVITILVPVAEYDVYLPEDASGLAIWHVDEAVAAMDYYPFDIQPNNFEANTLQWDPNRRFIRLVEADGIIDFGGNYSRGYGVKEDLFYAGNNTTLGSFTNPASLSNSGGYTHIKISNISEPGLVMSFDLTQEKRSNNFPRRTSIPEYTMISPIAADLDDDGNDEILIASGNKILAVTADGMDYMDPFDSLFDYDTLYSAIDVSTNVNIFRPTDTSLYSMPVFGEILSGTITTSPVIAKFYDSTVVMAGTDEGYIYTYLPYSTALTTPAKYRARVHSFRSVSGGGEVRSILPDTSYKTVYAFFDDGDLLVFPWDTIATFAEPTFDFNETFIGACRFKDGLALLYERIDYTVLIMTRFASYSGIVDSFFVDSVVIDETGFFAPVAADIDRDDNDDVILLSRNGHVLGFSFTPDGIYDLENIDIQTGDTATVGPVLADFTKNGFADIIYTGINKIYGFNRAGMDLPDFPVTVDQSRSGQLIISGPLVSDFNNDDYLDLAIISFDSIPRARQVRGYNIDYPDPVNYPDSFIVTDTIFNYSFFNYYSNLYVISPAMGDISGFPVPVGVFGMKQLSDTTIGVSTPLHIKNGNDGMLIVNGADGWMDSWSCGWSDENAYWTMSGRTADNSRYLSLDALGNEIARSEFLPEASFYNYPNPASGSHTTIRFYVNQPANVTISIYDAVGDKVNEMIRDIEDGNRDAEVIWDLTGVASGIYHCRIEAVAADGTESETAFTTIAIVK